MTTEPRPEQAIPSEDATLSEDAEVPPTSRRVAYKSVLVAAVVGIITVSGLSFFVERQQRDSSLTVEVPDVSLPTQEATTTTGTEVAQVEDAYKRLDRRLTSLSNRIDRGFEAQQAHSQAVGQSFTTLTERVRAVNVAVAKLSESNQVLAKRINEAISRLDTLIKVVRKRKVVQHKPPAKPTPRPAKTPPFRIDAIDIWDDMTYVAISQAGRVAFLKAGERQSGWTVTRIDRLKGRVDLTGPAGQVHSVSLPR